MDVSNSTSVSQRLPSSALAASSAHYHSQRQTSFASVGVSAVRWKHKVYLPNKMITCITSHPANTVRSLTSSYSHGLTTPKTPPTSWTKVAWKYIPEIQSKAASWPGDVPAPQTLEHVRFNTYENRTPSSHKKKNQHWMSTVLVTKEKRHATATEILWYIFGYVHEI